MADVITKGDLARTEDTTAAQVPNCPHVLTVGDDLVLYRLVRHNPPVADDILTTAEAGLNPSGNPCLRQAVSLSDTSEAANALKRSIPSFRSRYIAVGTIRAGDGLKAKTLGTGHWSWWPRNGIHRHSIFSVL